MNEGMYQDAQRGMYEEWMNVFNLQDSRQLTQKDSNGSQQATPHIVVQRCCCAAFNSSTEIE